MSPDPIDYREREGQDWRKDTYTMSSQEGWQVGGWEWEGGGRGGGVGGGWWVGGCGYAGPRAGLMGRDWRVADRK